MAGEAQVKAPLDLGAWQADRPLLEVAPRSLYGDVDRLPESVRFQVYVSRLVQLRERQADAETAGAAAFVLVTPRDQQNLKDAGRRLDRTVHSGQVRLAGRVHFMTYRAQSSVYEEHTGDANAVYDRIAELQCDKLPTLVYFPSNGESTLSYYPHGTHTDEGMVKVELSAGPVTEAEILVAINAVYRTQLCTPDNSGPTKIWQDAGKCHPVKEAERTVQQFVQAGLAGKFHWCTIRAEQSGKLGRTDLEIVDDRNGDPGLITHHALLELKVLRSFGSTGSEYAPAANDDAIVKGLNQANSYGEANNSLLRMLCCFDMRSNDVGDAATFAHVQAEAKTLGVGLRRWYLYRSSDDMREALTKLQLEASSNASVSNNATHSSPSDEAASASTCVATHGEKIR